MRIGIGSRTIEPSTTRGHIDGIGTYTKNLIEEYQKQYCQVVPILFPPFTSQKVQPQLPGSLQFPFSYPISSLTNFIGPLSHALNRKIEKEISIFHATDYRIPRLKNIPDVATLHDPIMLKYPQWTNQSLRGIKNWLLKASAKWAQRYIADSAAMVPELVEYWGVDEDKIDVVHIGINDEWSVPVSEAEKQRVIAKYNLPANYMLFVGTLQPRKNIDRVIKAFKQLPVDMQKEYKLVLVGKNGWRTEELIKEIKDIAEKNRILWLEYIPADDIYALYQCASLFLFPSLYEGFGLPILEAFASRVPVITSNITSMPEIAGDAAYLVDPYDVDQIQYAISKLLSDKQLRQDYIQKGAERVKAFNWKACAEKTLAIYKKLVS